MKTLLKHQNDHRQYEKHEISFYKSYKTLLKKHDLNTRDIKCRLTEPLFFSW